MHLAQCISVRSLRIGITCNFLFNKYDLQGGEKGKALQLIYFFFRDHYRKAKVSQSNLGDLPAEAVLSQTQALT